MGKEMPPTFATFYTDFAAKQEANRIRLLEEARKVERVTELFKQGVNILEEFGEARKGKRDIAGTSNVRGIRVSTPFVVLEHEGKVVNFTMQGFKPNHGSPKSPSPDSYESVSVHTVNEGYSKFDIDNSVLFSFTFSKTGLVSQIKKNNHSEVNDSRAIEAASELFDAIQQSLSETHTPRSQQVKPKPEKRGLANIFRHLYLKPVGKL